MSPAVGRLPKARSHPSRFRRIWQAFSNRSARDKLDGLMLKKTWVRLALVLLMTAVFLFFFFRSVNDWGAVLRSFGRDQLAGFPPDPPPDPAPPRHPRPCAGGTCSSTRSSDVRFANLFAGNAVGFMVNFPPSGPARGDRQAALLRPEGVRPAGLRPRDGRRRADLRHPDHVRPPRRFPPGPAALRLAVRRSSPRRRPG